MTLQTPIQSVVGDVLSGMGGEIENPLILNWPLYKSITPTTGAGAPTFTRATTALVQDNDDEWNEALSGEARFPGMRRVENLLSYSNDLSNAAWTKAGTATVTGTNTVNLPTDGDIVSQNITAPQCVDKTYLWRVKLTGSGTVLVRIISTGGAYQGLSTTITLSSTPTVFSALLKFTDEGSVNPQFGIRRNATTATTLTVEECQLELVPTGTTVPSEYVSTDVLSAPYHGAGVDGVKYFSTTNGNTVASNVVTEGTGRAIDGYSIEQTTNGKFATDTDWTKDASTTIANDKATCDGTQGGNIDMVKQSSVEAIAAGAVYEMTFTLSDYSAGDVWLWVGQSSKIGTHRTANGTYTELITLADATTDDIKVRADATFVGSISNFSIKRKFTQPNGYLAEPLIQNKCTAYSLPGSDQLGSELIDTDALTMVNAGVPYGWVAYGTNTIAAVGDTMEITWVDQSNGAYWNMRDTNDLSTNLTLGRRYRVTVEAKVSAGSGVSVSCYDGVTVNVITASIAETFTTYTYDFTCYSAQSSNLVFANMGAGEKVYVNSMSLKEIQGTNSATGAGVSGLGTGATAYHDGTFTGTDPDIQNPIPNMTLSGSETEGSALLTGTDSDQSGANSWISNGWATMDVNTTVAGKLYCLGDGGNDFCAYAGLITSGNKYSFSIKARLNAGAGAAIRAGSGLSSANTYVEFNPTGTEATFTGTFVAHTDNFYIGMNDGSTNGMAYELDDIEIVELTYPATLEVVDDSAEILAAGFSKLNPSGKVYKLDNSGGATNAAVTIEGQTGNTNTHRATAFARAAVGGANLKVTITGDDIGWQTTTTTYARFDDSALTPSGVGNKLWIRALIGQTIYFFLPQLEENTVVSSPILCNGAATTRNEDQLTLPSTGNFSQTEGVCLADVAFPYAAGDSGKTSFGLIGPKLAVNTVLSYQDTTVNFRTADGTNWPVSQDQSFVANQVVKVAARWNTSANDMRTIADGSGGSVAGYDGSFASTGVLVVGGYKSTPVYIKNIRIYNEDKGQAWCEGQTS